MYDFKLIATQTTDTHRELHKGSKRSENEGESIPERIRDVFPCVTTPSDEETCSRGKWKENGRLGVYDPKMTATQTSDTHRELHKDRKRSEDKGANILERIGDVLPCITTLSDVETCSCLSGKGMEDWVYMIPYCQPHKRLTHSENCMKRENEVKRKGKPSQKELEMSFPV